MGEGGRLGRRIWRIWRRLRKGLGGGEEVPALREEAGLSGSAAATPQVRFNSREGGGEAAQLLCGAHTHTRSHTQTLTRAAVGSWLRSSHSAFSISVSPGQRVQLTRSGSARVHWEEDPPPDPRHPRHPGPPDPPDSPPPGTRLRSAALAGACRARLCHSNAG